MKTTSKKRKRRGSKKITRSKNESKAEIVLKSDSSLVPKDREVNRKSNQVIQKKGSEKRQEDKNQIFRYVNIITQFLKDSKMELKKVKWPTRKELLASTAMVIFLVLAVAFFLGVIDFGLIKVIKKIVG